MRVQSYSTFWQRIHQSAKAKGIPLRVMFELTYRCNFRCKHCYIPSSYRAYGELKTQDVYSILDQLAEIGCFYLGFTGGEPFMRKDILEIIAYAKRKGFEVIIYTNGSLIDKASARKLGRLRLNKVDITIPGMSRRAFEAVSGVRGSRDRVFKAIELLRQNGVVLGFKTCVLKENYEEINQIQDFAASLGSLHRLDNRLSRRLDGSLEPYRYRGALSLLSSLGPLQERREDSQRNEQNEPSILFKCGVGLSQAAITPQGELKPCLMIDAPKYKIRLTGNSFQITGRRYQVAGKCLKQEGVSLAGAWEKLQAFVGAIKPDREYRCAACDLNAYCKWCPAKGWLSSGSFTACDPDGRAQAEMMLRTPNVHCGM